MRVHAGEIAHVFVGGALAAPPALLAWVFVTAFSSTIPSPLTRWALVLLAVFAAVVIGAVATSPVVRPAEIAIARVLLGVDLPDSAEPRALTSRLLGAGWATLVALIGALVALAELLLLPVGVGLAVLPFQGADLGRLPGGLLLPVPPWPASLVLVPLGVAVAMAGLAVVPAAGALECVLAPGFLGPSDADNLASSQRRERELAQANHLARELHDSLGHALTAITIQADAVERLATSDPPAAAASGRALGDVARAALDSLDDVLASLRGGTVPESAPAIGDVLATSGRLLRLTTHVDDVPAGVRPVVARVLREALTNAARHGTGSAEVRVTGGSPVCVEVTNPIAPTRWAAPGGRGLAGLRETVRLAGGTVDAGERAGQWTLHVTLPTREDADD